MYVVNLGDNQERKKKSQQHDPGGIARVYDLLKNLVWFQTPRTWAKNTIRWVRLFSLWCRPRTVQDKCNLIKFVPQLEKN